MDTNDNTIGYNVRKSFLENIITIFILYFRGKRHSKQKNGEENSPYHHHQVRIEAWTSIFSGPPNNYSGTYNLKRALNMIID